MKKNNAKNWASQTPWFELEAFCTKFIISAIAPLGLLHSAA